MSQALYRKWRPQRWDQVVGQEHIVQTLRNAIAAGRVAHAYLFSGPRGTGKTTTARLLAKAVNCLDPDIANRPCDACENCTAINQGRFLDLIEIDAASNNSVEDVRSLRDKINFSPNSGKYKIYIIDEVHMLSTSAFNALLKTLEEPPSHAIFVLATTEAHKIPATVLSRCQRHEFRRVAIAEIVRHLKEMSASEGLTVDEDALTLIARQATGSLRDAISLLDLLSSSGQTVSLKMAQEVLGTTTLQAVIEVIDAIYARETKAGLEAIHKALDGGTDARQLARQVTEYLRGLLLVKMGNAGQVEATPEMRQQMNSHAQAFSAGELLRLIRAFNQAASEARLIFQPALPLELAFVEALEKPAAQAPAAQPAENRRHPAKESAAAKESASKETQAKGADASAAQPQPAGSGELTMESLNQSWKKVLAQVDSSNKHAAALLRSGKLLGIKDNVLLFGLSEVLKGQLEKKESLDLVIKTVREVIGKEYSFACVLSTGKGNSIPSDVDRDGMVATALRDLGGEIVDIQ